MKITVEIKTVYGIDKVYPVCDKAKIFSKLLNQTVLTDSDIKNIKLLGYEIEVSNKNPESL